MRSDIKSKIIKNIYTDLSSLFDTNINAPTTLIELTKSQHLRFRDNSIHMIGMDFKDCIPVCRKACYGEKISLSKKKINYGGIHSSTSYQCVNLTKTKKRYVLITADKKDCMTMLPAAKSKISILSNGGDENDISSGVILLMFAVLPADTVAINAKNWNEDMVSMIKSCKKNVLPTYDHHGTTC